MFDPGIHENRAFGDKTDLFIKADGADLRLKDHHADARALTADTDRLTDHFQADAGAAIGLQHRNTLDFQLCAVEPVQAAGGDSLVAVEGNQVVADMLLAIPFPL